MFNHTTSRDLTFIFVIPVKCFLHLYIIYRVNNKELECKEGIKHCKYNVRSNKVFCNVQTVILYVLYDLAKKETELLVYTENPKCKKTDIVSFVPVVYEVSSFVVNPV